jgi:hypothetical protein
MSRRRVTPTLDDIAPQTRTLLHACLAAEDDRETEALLARARLVCPATVRELLALLAHWRRMRERSSGA